MCLFANLPRRSMSHRWSHSRHRDVCVCSPFYVKKIIFILFILHSFLNCAHLYFRSCVCVCAFSLVIIRNGPSLKLSVLLYLIFSLMKWIFFSSAFVELTVATMPSPINFPHAFWLCRNRLSQSIYIKWEKKNTRQRRRSIFTLELLQPKSVIITRLICLKFKHTHTRSRSYIQTSLFWITYNKWNCRLSFILTLIFIYFFPAQIRIHRSIIRLAIFIWCCVCRCC